MYSGKTAANSRWEQKNQKEASLHIEEPEDFFFQAINRWGESIRCEVLFTFQSGGQDYLVYTDNTRTLGGRLNIYATLYHPETLASGKPLYLRDPQTEAEWGLIRRTAKNVLDLI